MNIIKKVLRRIIMKVGRLFFDVNKIKGKYFNEDGIGAKWILRGVLWQKILGFNSDCKWPVSHRVQVSGSNNIEFHPNDMHIFHTFGTYFQATHAKIFIGEGTWIAPNVGLITANHDKTNLEKHDIGEDIIIGKSCWIGMNSIVLPGVELGNKTIVGAGSVVTKSFMEGNCVIVGNPAKIIKWLDDDRE